MQSNQLSFRRIPSRSVRELMRIGLAYRLHQPSGSSSTPPSPQPDRPRADVDDEARHQEKGFIGVKASGEKTRMCKGMAGEEGQHDHT